MLVGSGSDDVVELDDYPRLIGADQQRGRVAFALQGDIDDVRLHRRALTQAELATLAADERQ